MKETDKAYEDIKQTDNFGDGDIPQIDLEQSNESVEPLPESTRPRKDGPGGD